MCVLRVGKTNCYTGIVYYGQASPASYKEWALVGSSIVELYRFKCAWLSRYMFSFLLLSCILSSIIMHRNKILVSQDVVCRHKLCRYGGNGYGHILEHVVPKMRERGISNDIIRSMTVENPRQWLIPHRQS